MVKHKFIEFSMNMRATVLHLKLGCRLGLIYRFFRGNFGIMRHLWINFPIFYLDFTLLKFYIKAVSNSAE